MIAYLNGRLDSKTPATAVVECGGVGYRCLIPLSTYDRLPATGESVKLLTCLVVREDAQTLYGFATEDEQQTFELVTSVSGVGPKLALAILSGLTVGDLQLTIAEGNAKRLAAVKGIGKKTAERIVVELKDKVNPIEALAHGKAAAYRRQRHRNVREIENFTATLQDGTKVVKVPAKRCAKIALALDAEGLAPVADGGDLVAVTATLSDGEGNPKRYETETIRFSVEGEADIVGTNPQVTRWGEAVVLVRPRASANPKPIKVRAATIRQGRYAPSAGTLEFTPGAPGVRVTSDAAGSDAAIRAVGRQQQAFEL